MFLKISQGQFHLLLSCSCYGNKTVHCLYIMISVHNFFWVYDFSFSSEVVSSAEKNNFKIFSSPILVEFICVLLRFYVFSLSLPWILSFYSLVFSIVQTLLNQLHCLGNVPNLVVIINYYFDWACVGGWEFADLISISFKLSISYPLNSCIARCSTFRRCREKQRKEASRLQTVNRKLTAMNKLLMEENDRLQKQVSHLVYENGYMRTQLQTVSSTTILN